MGKPGGVTAMEREVLSSSPSSWWTTGARVSFRVTFGSEFRLLLLGEHVGKKRAGFRTGLNGVPTLPYIPHSGFTDAWCPPFRSRINHSPRTHLHCG